MYKSFDKNIRKIIENSEKYSRIRNIICCYQDINFIESAKVWKVDYLFSKDYKLDFVFEKTACECRYMFQYWCFQIEMQKCLCKVVCQFYIKISEFRFYSYYV